MKIIKTNIQENEYTMELMFAMFEDENRIRLSDTAGTNVEFNHYAIVEDENAKGNVVRTSEKYLYLSRNLSVEETFLLHDM